MLLLLGNCGPYSARLCLTDLMVLWEARKQASRPSLMSPHCVGLCGTSLRWQYLSTCLVTTDSLRHTCHTTREPKMAKWGFLNRKRNLLNTSAPWLTGVTNWGKASQVFGQLVRGNSRQSLPFWLSCQKRGPAGSLPQNFMLPGS